MGRIVYISLFSLLLVSYGTRSGYPKTEGRFLHMNQGEPCVYSPDGGIADLDTIKVEVGHFSYEEPCSKLSALTIILPNYSAQPIFAKSGEVAKVKADASHLKEMEAEGTKDNELMTKFRKQIASASPPRELKYAIVFIKDHSESAVSVYLLNRYLVQTESPDYRQAVKLLSLLIEERPDNATLGRLQRHLSKSGSLPIDDRSPKFPVKDVSGEVINNASLQGKDVVIINAQATWSCESLDIQCALNNAVKAGKIAALGICVDASPEEVKQTLERDGTESSNVCNGKLLDTPLLKTLGLNTIPDNIVIHNGRVIERNITASTIRRRYGAEQRLIVCL